MSEPNEVVIGGNVVRFPRPAGHEKQDTSEMSEQGPAVEQEQATPEPDSPAAEVEGPIVEAELVEEAPGQRPVDTPAVRADEGTWMERRRAMLAEAPPVVPSYLRHRDEFTELSTFAVHYYAHACAFHATRAPIYLLRLMGRSPRGTHRLLSRWARWISDVEARPVETKAAASGDIQAWLTLSREHSRRVRPRRVTSAVVAVPTAAVVVVAALTLPPWAIATGTAAVLALLGLAGKVEDHPIITRYVSVQLQRPLDSEEVTSALEAIGIKGKPDFVNPIQVDGPGWKAELDLPRGTKAETIMEKRDELAGAMRRPVSTVWPATAPDAHPGRLELWVAKRDPAKEPRRIWPLMHQGQADVFAPIPLGWDPRGNQVDITLMYSNLLVGGIPGSGKTSAALAVALGVALDPTAKLWVYELKGSGDLGSVRPVCHRYVSGDDDEDVEATVQGLRSAVAEQRRRKKFIQGLPVAEVPDGRRTSRELAEKYPEQDLDPMVVIVDEAQELFTHEEYGKEAEELCTRLIKKARAYGIILVLLTQDPDAKSLPPSVSRNAGTRFCLAVMDWRANNNVLGTGAYARGLRANTISAKEVGTGILAKQRDWSTVRSAFILQTEAETIGKRALALRIAAGTLSGEAAGEEVVHEDASTIVDHLRAVWPEGTKTVHSHRLVEALAAYRGDLYGTWLDTDRPLEEMSPEERERVKVARSTMLTNALKPHKVATHQFTIRECCGGAKGVKFADLPEPHGGAEEIE
ncbi:S-DNA-T family DNA segregation ATPase FtsK/SpoIIIE [Lipingzhangella halophila]|uniref:S-DNA-T family DNA segregation ATPase FtsK/SpoIIIE n=1 Tax=Lipingzhangella halophila TaxID=1783352 RepID=A0A7W7RG87_9ACTN|nr:FtsK/SpoIIIE domain-containing protein [Lipingzhangella halophila]MBB4931397.1 S-DNA-T family DNA segregation ATPase FtsK/SpoIIIE [Lipingzhangella halophila]